MSIDVQTGRSGAIGGEGVPPEVRASTAETSQQTQDQLAAIRTDIATLKHDVVGIEHRLVQVVRNAYWAATQRDGWTPAKRLEAGAALIRYVLAGRAVLAVSVGLGGLLALHASFMLTDQNRKLDLQNHLAVVSAELGEAQRNAQFAQLIPGVIESVKELDARSPGAATVSYAAGVQLRIAVLTQTFQPYRWVEKAVVDARVSEPVGDGAVFRTVQRLRQAYASMFGRSAFDAPVAGMPALSVPVLTTQRYSPERGLILINLHALRFDLRTLTRYNATFDRAFAPGARLDDIRLDGLVGPDLSKPMHLQSAYLQGATFNRAHLGSVLFIDTNLRGAELNSITAADSNWSRADLSDTQLKGAFLVRGNFNGTNLSRANLMGANLAHAQLSTAIGVTAGQLIEACVSPKTTRLPNNIVLRDYRIPDDCCDSWKDMAAYFARDPSGVCRAKD